MDLWEAVVVAFRRWYVMVPVLLVIGIIVALPLAQSVAPLHEASATVQYLPPPVSDLRPGDRVRQVGQPLLGPSKPCVRHRTVGGIGGLRSSDSRDRGSTPISRLEIDRREPVLTIATQSTSADSTLSTLDALVEFAVDEARIRQEQQFVGGDPEFFVVADVPFRDTSTTIDLTSRTRARVLLLAVAAVLAMGAAVAVESVLAAIERQRLGDTGERADPGVVWFGVPLQGGQSLPQAVPTSQPYLSPAPDEPVRLTGTTGDEADDRPSARVSMVALSDVASPTPTRGFVLTTWRPDAVSVLTLLIAAAFLIPARYTFPPLGGAGRLDIMLGVAMLVWWVVTRAVPSLTVRDRQPLRLVLWHALRALRLRVTGLPARSDHDRVQRPRSGTDRLAQHRGRRTRCDRRDPFLAAGR